MKKLAFVLAVMTSTPANAAERFIDSERWDAIVEQAPRVCHAAYIASDTQAFIMAYMSGWPLAEKLLLLDLCKVYGRGMIAGIEGRRTT